MIEFRSGETIHTENSYKYSSEFSRRLRAGRAGSGRGMDGCRRQILLHVLAYDAA